MPAPAAAVLPARPPSVVSAALPASVVSAWPLVLTGLAVAAGVALRGLAFASDRPLWIDEAMLARNVVERSPAGLFAPLDHHQVAPTGFLLLTKTSVTLLGPTESALRLVPFVGSLAGLAAFAWAAARWLPAPAARLAVAVYALSPTLVSYSAEAKQYATDAAIAAGLLAIVAPLFRSDDSGLAVPTVLGAAAVWLSHPAVFVLGGFGAALAVSAVRTGRRARLIPPLVWAGSFAAVYLTHLRFTAGDRFLSDYWAPHFTPASASAAPWLLEHLVDVFRTAGGFGGLTFQASGLAAVLAAVGVMNLWRTGRAAEAAAVLAAVGLTVLAAAAGKYPFTGRLLLFLAPAAILLVAAGAMAVADGLRRWSPLAAAGILAVTVAAPAVEAVQQYRHPPRTEDLPAVLAFVAERWRPGDTVYVYNGAGDSGAGPAFRFYGHLLPVPDGAVVLGRVCRDDPHEYRRDVFALPRPGRVWAVFSHRYKDDEAVIRAYFEATADRGAEFQTTGAAGYEYTLK